MSRARPQRWIFASCEADTIKPIFQVKAVRIMEGKGWGAGGAGTRPPPPGSSPDGAGQQWALRRPRESSPGRLE